MDIQKRWGTKLVQRILWLMMVSAFMFFVLGQVLLPAENNTEESTFRIFQSEWERVMLDGTHIPVSVPGECGAQRGDWELLQRHFHRIKRIPIFVFEACSRN